MTETNRESYIDSLRGFSIFLVFFFHFEKFTHQEYYFFNNGYLGVDIFFLISGYILTKNIFNQKKITPPSPLKFLFKRFKRLFPILSLMIITFSILFFFFYSKDNFINIFQSSLFSLFFFSNFYFAYTPEIKSYHELVSEPFLHTWSLAVEFQIYIFFIFFIYFNYKKNFKFLNTLLIITFVTSLFSSLLIDHFYKSYNFYLTTSRIWEFCLGCLIAYNSNFLRKKILYFSKYLKIFFFFVILFFLKIFNNSYAIYNSTIVILLILTSISCLIVLRKDKIVLFDIIINNCVFSFLGKISYSIYIWHFPIMVFYSLVIKSYFEIEDVIILSSIIFFISLISYFFIELKFNKYEITKQSIKIIFSIFIISLFVLHFLSKFAVNKIYSNKIFLNNNFYVLEEENYHGGGNFYQSKAIYNFSDSNKKKILVIGNSMGRDLYNMLSYNKDITKEFEIAYIGTQITCLEKLLKNFINCHNTNINDIQKNYILNADYFFISSRWNKNDVNNINFFKDLKKKIVIFSNNNEFNFGKSHTLLDVFLIINSKTPNISELDLLEKKLFKKINLNVYKINFDLKKFANQNNLLFINLNNIGCNFEKKKCKILTSSNEKIYLDYGHLTLSGAKFFSKTLGKIIFENVK